ncbi:MAG: hypothetical protein Q8P20_01640 [bacterium]|nr:hypothetical protein [bacterium]
MNIILALVVGITSAFVYSMIQGLYLYFRWVRTRRFFLSEIKGSIMYLDYYVTTILNINPIYETEFETDHLMTHEEFISEIQNIVIDKEQFERLNNALKHTREKIEKARKEALLIPTFTSRDFHAVDKFVMEISMFLSSYSWLNEEISKSEISDKLKNKLIKILNIAKENIFPNNFLDKIRQWRNRRKLFNSKHRYKKFKKEDSASEEDILPF